jgi:hypothetical protein
MIVENKRRIVKRSSVSGIYPIQPDSGVTSPYEPDETWSANMCLPGEFFYNIADEILYFKMEGDDYLTLGDFISGTTTFDELTDTPPTKTGYAGYSLRVNAGESDIEYFELNYPTMFVNLDDTPSEFDGYAGYCVVVSSGETSLEFKSINNELIYLEDVELNGYTEGVILVGNGLAMEGVLGNEVFVDLETDQNVSGVKTFDDAVVLNNSLYIKSEIEFSGITESVMINNISTDETFFGVTDNEISTSKAVRAFVLNQSFVTGDTTGFVDLDSEQTILGEKTFDATTNFSDINVESIENSGNLNNALTSYIYFGSENVDGSFRLFLNVLGDLEIQKRISGVWTFRISI